MSASSSWFLVFSCALTAVGCSSPETHASPDEGDSSLTFLEPPDSPQQGGQSGTDADGSYACDGEGAPPLQQVSLYEVPEGYSCTPNLVLRELEGTYTLDC